jgi:L-aspartate oxidase
VIRDGAGLRRALAEIARLERESADDPALRNMATAALMVTAGAFTRHESRGGHYRADYPKTDPALAKRTFLTLADARRIAAEAAREPELVHA